MSKHGRPVFVAVPFDAELLRQGVGVSLAVTLFTSHKLSLGRAAKLAAMSTEAFMDILGQLGIAVIDYDPNELKAELAAIA